LQRQFGGIETALESRRTSPQLRAQEADWFFQPRPSLIEANARTLVATLGRTWPNSENEPAAGHDVQRGRGLGQRRRSADNRQGCRGRELHASAALENAGQRYYAVQPRILKDKVVIRADEVEAKLACRICVRS